MDPLKIISVLLALVLISILVYLITRQVKEYHSMLDPKLSELMEIVKGAIVESYNKGNLCQENGCLLEEKINQDGGAIESFKKITLHKGDKSYSLNKHKIYLCLKDNNGEYYDQNMLIFVLVHEVAHCLCSSIGHTPEWQAINDQILRCLIKQGKYTPRDPNNLSIPPIMEYCGT